jgi:hypothetical protein
MGGGDRLVPRGSATYQEFARLYQLARSIRPTGVDRWNRDLYASDSDTSLGGFNPRTGAMRLSGRAVLPYLTGGVIPDAPDAQSQALATVIHETTHASIETDDPAEPNAIRSKHSLGLLEGVAELRAIEDFRLFTRQAGYFGLAVPRPQYDGAYAATDSLVNQAAGARRDRVSIINDLAQGPAVSHFDRLAHGVVQNRLWELVPHQEDHQRAARAALIPAMLHELWPNLHDEKTSTGAYVADRIRQALNAKVDEIRRHYHSGNRGPFDADQPNRYADRTSGASRQERFEAGSRADVAGGLRFLSAQAPAGGAVTRRPSLGHGERLAGAAHLARPGRLAGPSQPAR